MEDLFRNYWWLLFPFLGSSVLRDQLRRCRRFR